MPKAKKEKELVVDATERKPRKIEYDTHIPLCKTCIPDIVFKDKKLAVFADGDYWHSKEFNGGKTWSRDRKQEEVLVNNGWSYLRFWEHEINYDVVKCVDEIIGELND